MKALIVFYSNTGNTSKLAKILASKLESETLEIKDRRNRKGLIGFLRAGFDAITSNVTIIDNFTENFIKYDLVLIGTPVWAGRVTPAIRTFLIGNNEVLPEVAFFTTHAGGGTAKTLVQLEKLANKEPLACLSIEKSDLIDDSIGNNQEINKYVKTLQKKFE
ncbi:MAG: flavodoxin family protein [Bacillota bacterium]